MGKGNFSVVNIKQMSLIKKNKNKYCVLLV